MHPNFLQRLIVACSFLAASFLSSGHLAAQAQTEKSGSLFGSLPARPYFDRNAGANRQQLVAMNLASLGPGFDAGGTSSSSDRTEVPDDPSMDEGQRYERAPTGREQGRIPRDPNYGHIGGAISVGASGLTADVAFPINRFFDFRLGASGFRYSHTFSEDVTDVQGSLQIAYGKAQVDFYPFAGHLRISPMLAFANFTHGIASVYFPGGKAFDLEEGTFISSPADPVRGYGRVDYRHTAPGLTIGLNNFTRGYGRFTFPVEIGAIYAGQPKLLLDFSGTACSNVQCMRVQDYADFQEQLKTVQTRVNDDLRSYAQFLPVLNIGVGYRF